MQLHSIQYLAFLCVAVAAYYATPWRARWITLFVVSFGFYMSWRLEFGLVLLSVIAVQYFLAIRIARQADPAKRRRLLLASLAAGLGFLVYFKYTAAIRTIFLVLLSTSIAKVPAPAPWFVPIGISFYTLQMLGYLLDVYNGRREPETRFGVFAVFVSFFPIVLSGPIERADHLLPQLQPEKQTALLYDNVSKGIKLIIWGFFLKLVIADRAALYVDAVFGHPDRHSGLSFIAAAIFYSFQIYCDFAGYSSVAIGSAKLMGIDILENFRRPYLASSIRDFWRRWHISLSEWLRDYVFMPLAYTFSEWLPVEKYEWAPRFVYVAAIFITFALCGLWHGPAATFLVWGCLHGIYLALENVFEIGLRRTMFGIARTYTLVLLSFVFFRSASVSGALEILMRIATAPGRLYIPGGADVVAPLYAAAGIALLITIEIKREFYSGRWSFFGHRSEYVRVLAYSLLVGIIVSMGVFDGGQFIYAQF